MGQIMTFKTVFNSLYPYHREHPEPQQLSRARLAIVKNKLHFHRDGRAYIPEALRGAGVGYRNKKKGEP